MAAPAAAVTAQPAAAPTAGADSDSDDDEPNLSTDPVILGYVDECPAALLRSSLFESKLGGRPSWLGWAKVRARCPVPCLPCVTSVCCLADPA